MRTASYLIAVVLGLALTLGAVPAQAETTACNPITTLPATISVQGIYCFTQHLNTGMTTGHAIEIQANNVILDLNGFKLGGLAAGPGTQAIGIFAVDRQNITIKNGTVRGFLKGIVLRNSGILANPGGHVVEDIRADQNTHVGIEVEGGRGNLIRNNQVVATGGATIFGPNAFAFGISAGSFPGVTPCTTIESTGTRVLNNDVIDTQKQGTGVAIGILFCLANDVLAVNNRITNADQGIHFESSDGKFRDNLTTGVPPADRFLGGTDAGNNN